MGIGIPNIKVLMWFTFLSSLVCRIMHPQITLYITLTTGTIHWTNNEVHLFIIAIIIANNLPHLATCKNKIKSLPKQQQLTSVVKCLPNYGRHNIETRVYTSEMEIEYLCVRDVLGDPNILLA